jgi:hypothetical protein
MTTPYQQLRNYNYRHLCSSPISVSHINLISPSSIALLSLSLTQDRPLWSTILDEDLTFVFMQPYVMFRHFHSTPPCDLRAALSRSNSMVSSSSMGSQSRLTPGRRSNSHGDGAAGGGGSVATTTDMAASPFRKNSGQVYIEGIDGMMVDCASLKLMVEGIGEGTRNWIDSLFK